MVMPDWSLVVTTFSRQSWLLQRTATSVTSMATFADKEIQFVQPMQSSCQYRCTPSFWTPLRKSPAETQLLRDRASCTGRREGMQTALKVGTGVNDSQSVVIRVSRAYGGYCLN